MAYNALVFLHILVCISLILIVLFQAGKGAGLGNLFGGGGADQLFSVPSGSAFLKKLTTIIAVMFVFTSLGLTIFGRRSGHSVFDNVPMPTAPSTPAPTAP